jgi:hypothetical protein
MSQFADDPLQPKAWSDGYFRDAATAQGDGRLDRGLIGHVPIVAALLIVQGLLEIGFSLFGLAFAAFMFWGPPNAGAAQPGIAIMYVILSAPALATGILRIVAGIFNVFYRRRGLGIAAMAVGLITLMTGCCAATSIGLAIYGLIVYVDEPVIAAFALGERGQSPAEIQGSFSPRQ